jgi:hypothetical protein
MDPDVPDTEAQAAVAGVVAHVACSLDRIATTLERIAGGFKVDRQ